MTGRHATLDWFSRRLHLTEFLSILGSFGVIYVPVDNRKAPREALATALARPLPSYARWPRVLGLSVVVLLIFQVMTGALLALYYQPTPATAYDSVALILREVNFGWIVHQAHFWGGQLLLLVLLARVLRYLAHGIYRAPRELEWLLAIGLLATAVVADLSGRLLLWSNDAYWLGVRTVEALAALPLIGPAIGFLLGGEGTYLSGLTLIRTYGLHLAIAPTAFLLLVYLHFSTVRRLGLNERRGEPVLSGMAALRRNLAEIAMVFVVVLAALITLAVLSPQAFSCAADPYATPPDVRPPWYLLGVSGLFDLTRGLVPPTVAVLALFLAAGALPFLDRSRRSGRRVRWGIAAGLLAAWLLLTVYALGAAR